MVDLACGFANSSDTYFYQVAARVGYDRLSYWAHQLGLGAPTGVDLPNEASGIIPSSQWKMQMYGEPVYPGDVAQAGIGQGFDAVSPLQLLNAYAAVINGGTLSQPRVVDAIIGPDGVATPTEPQVIRQLDVSPKILKMMRQNARRVVTRRHTGNLTDLPIVVAGVTFDIEPAAIRMPVQRRAGWQARVDLIYPWPSLAPRFWLPTWHDAGTAGRFPGAATYGVDAIGRTAYFAQVAVAPSKGRVEANAQVTHQRWKAFALDASYVASWDSLLSRRGLLKTDSTTDTVYVTYGDLQQTVGLGGTLRWRRWRSFLSARVGGELEAERLVVDRVDLGPPGIRPSKDHFTFAGVVASVARGQGQPAMVE